MAEPALLASVGPAVEPREEGKAIPGGLALCCGPRGYGGRVVVINRAGHA